MIVWFDLSLSYGKSALVRVLQPPRRRRRRVHEVAGVHVDREGEALGDVERRRAVAAVLVAPLAALGALALVEDVVLRRRPQLGEEDELEPHRRADHEDAHEREEAVALGRLVGHELWHGSGGGSCLWIGLGRALGPQKRWPATPRRALRRANKSLRREIAHLANAVVCELQQSLSACAAPRTPCCRAQR